MNIIIVIIVMNIQVPMIGIPKLTNPIYIYSIPTTTLTIIIILVQVVGKVEVAIIITI